MASTSRRTTLTTQILIAMVAGAIIGALINAALSGVPWVQSWIVDGLFDVVGDVFIKALKMLVVPLVLVSLVCGVTALGDIAMLGRVGGKAIVLYLFTTAVAITLALTLASIIEPGTSLTLEAAEASFEGAPAPPLSDVLVNLVPANPVAALADAEMLQIIVFALLFGVAITLAGERGSQVLNLFTDLNAVVMKMVSIIIRVAPYGVFCLIAKTFATQGLSVIAPLAAYFVTVLVVLVLHAMVTYGLLLTFVARLNPLRFFVKMRDAMLFAFSTASSNATIPVTLRSVEERLGVKNAVASFTVPLGATINMDGTAIMQGVATVFIANVYGVDLGMVEFLMVILTATLASIGTAGVPGVGLIMLAMVLDQVGLPVEGIALIIGVDRFLDMTRTAVNITGDATITTLIGKSENAFDADIFADPEAGVLRDDDGTTQTS